MKFQHTTKRERREFVAGYMEAAPWASTLYNLPEDEVDQVEALIGFSQENRQTVIDSNQEPADSVDVPEHGGDHWAMARRALEFLASCERALSLAERGGRSWEYLGHDAFLTREGHGVGFWDRDDIRGKLRDILTSVAQADRSETMYWLEEDSDGDLVLRVDHR